MDARQYTKLCEGFSPVAKPDVTGYEVGYGFHGNNIVKGTTMTQAEADAAFPTYYAGAERTAMLALGPTWASLDLVRQTALTDMSYEMGTGLAEFHRMLAAITRGDWPEAADQCLDSSYARQVPARAGRTAYMLLHGLWPSGFGG